MLICIQARKIFVVECFIYNLFKISETVVTILIRPRVWIFFLWLCLI